VERRDRHPEEIVREEVPSTVFIKMTVKISDPLLRAANRLAAEESTSVRAIGHGTGRFSDRRVRRFGAVDDPSLGPVKSAIAGISRRRRLLVGLPA